MIEPELRLTETLSYEGCYPRQKLCYTVLYCILPNNGVGFNVDKPVVIYIRSPFSLIYMLLVILINHLLCLPTLQPRLLNWLWRDDKPSAYRQSIMYNGLMYFIPLTRLWLPLLYYFIHEPSAVYQHCACHAYQPILGFLYLPGLRLPCDSCQIIFLINATYKLSTSLLCPFPTIPQTSLKIYLSCPNVLSWSLPELLSSLLILVARSFHSAEVVAL